MKRENLTPPAIVEQDTEKLSKYRKIIVFYENAIAQGKFRQGERLPSEADLVRQFGSSRATVSRAMREMQLGGLVERRAGSGSYVLKGSASDAQLTFGVLIPNIGGMEIFESICGQIASESQTRGHSLLWAKVSSNQNTLNAEQVCEPYLRQKVSGVFFGPVEHARFQDEVNHRIASMLENAGIPIVLLDRDLVAFPLRSNHDLVGIDNYAVGHTLAQHLLECGCKSIAFVGEASSAPTVQARSDGVWGALLDADRTPTAQWNHVLNAADVDQVRAMLQAAKPDGIICANDKTAAELMQSLRKLNVRVPQDIKVAGIDDIRYATLLQPPLTTIHQPCQLIGTIAFQTMLERLADPTLPPRQIMLPVRLIVRESTVGK